MNSEYLIHSLDPLESDFPLFLQLEEIACKVVSMLKIFKELRDTTKEKKTTLLALAPTVYHIM